MKKLQMYRLAGVTFDLYQVGPSTVRVISQTLGDAPVDVTMLSETRFRTSASGDVTYVTFQGAVTAAASWILYRRPVVQVEGVFTSVSWDGLT